MMEIVRDFPPIYDEIKTVFPMSGRGVIFAWGNKIYNPSGVYIPLQLIAHERTLETQSLSHHRSAESPLLFPSCHLQ